MSTGVLTLSVEVNVPRGPNNGPQMRREVEEERATVERGQTYDAINQAYRPRVIPVMLIECTQPDAELIAARFRKENPGTLTKSLWTGPVQL